MVMSCDVRESIVDATLVGENVRRGLAGRAPQHGPSLRHVARLIPPSLPLGALAEHLLGWPQG